MHVLFGTCRNRSPLYTLSRRNVLRLITYNKPASSIITKSQNRIPPQVANESDKAGSLHWEC